MFEFILFCVVLWIFISRQNSRINSLESKIDSLINKNVSQAQNSSSVMNTTIPSVASNEIIKKDLAYSMGQDLNMKVREKKEEFHEATSGQILGRIGITALILGISFFLKYAFDNDWITPMGRIFIGILVGAILLGFGQYYRKKYLAFSEIMLGGGIAVLYLSVYSAYHYYDLVSVSITAVAMFLITLLTFAFSLWNEDSKLAILATIGGFATPFMIGNIGDNMIEIFAYTTLLNLGVLAISFFKKWPILVFAGLIGTIVNFSVWYFNYFETKDLGATVFFLAITFFIFLSASMYRILAEKENTEESDYVVLVVNTFVFFSYFYNIMTPEYKSSMGFFTVLISFLFMYLSYIAQKNNPENKSINIILPGLAVIFLSIAIPIQFSDSWVAIAVAWFIEAVILYVLASKMSSRGYQVMGLVVYAVALLYSFSKILDLGDRNLVAFSSEQFAVMLIAIISSYSISYVYYRYGSESIEIQKRGIAAFVILANVLTIFTFTRELNIYFDNNNNETYKSAKTTISIFWAIYATILTIIGFIKRTALLRVMGLVLFVITAVKIFVDVWDLGPIYRIVSFIGFGIITIGVSFLYAKYKDRLGEII